tara:strand:- start:19444 stop:19764 length:321 start_codon:yes stop_codon:yes gene_type:complete
MTLKQMQEDVDKWTGQFTPQYWPIHEMLARLIEEVGELAREINHVHGTKKKKQSEQDNSIEQELVDILFTVSCIANSQGMDLEAEWKKLMNEKQYGRDNERYEKKV